MNDRFRIRIWNKDKKYMHENVTMPQNFMVQYPNIDGDHFDTEKYIPMQCTGLKDKNEQLIYEGDILEVLEVTDIETIEHITQVCWKEAAFMISTFQENDTYLGGLVADLDVIYEGSIIGNIYQHPELLITANAPQLKEAE